jgi:hypothetical protein
MRPGDLVRIRKSHPHVKDWRRNYRKYGAPFIGKWAEEGESLLVLKELWSHQRLSPKLLVFGSGEIASLHDYLLKPCSKYWQVIADIRAKDS